jgi:hypothetical protein
MHRSVRRFKGEPREGIYEEINKEMIFHYKLVLHDQKLIELTYIFIGQCHVFRDEEVNGCSNSG